MIRNISIGIDVGSAMTRIVVGEFLKGEKNPKIIGIGEAATNGLRHGYVTHFDDAVKSIEAAKAMAEKTSGVKIRRAMISLGGLSLKGELSSGVAIISKADGEVTNLDIEKALADAEDNLNLNNKKVIHVNPLSFRLDGKDIQGRLEGLRGNKLEIKALFATYSVVHFEDLIEVIAGAGIEAMEVVACSLSGAAIALSEKQKIVGAALVNIGGETVTLSVFENGGLASLQTFSLGGADITNDIALGLKIPLERAESFKLGNVPEEYSKKKLNEIIEARFGDIFESIENHLKKIKRSELLPAGIVFIGGAANTLGIEEFSKSSLNLPSIVGITDIFGSTKTKLRDPSWFTAIGLIMENKGGSSEREGSFMGLFKDLKSTIKSSVKQLMP